MGRRGSFGGWRCGVRRSGSRVGSVDGDFVFCWILIVDIDGNSA